MVRSAASAVLERMFRAWSTGRHPRVMGIVNVTPDSFSDGGRLCRGSTPILDRVIDHAARCIAEGAELLDIGGESTRPGAAPVATAVELERVVPVVEALARRFATPLSVDTSCPEVIRAAAAAGASMINDVRALRRPGALAAAAEVGLPVCLMHMRGEPATMQDDPRYGDVVAEVKGFLAERVESCAAMGLPRDRLLVDPGFGFGKTLEHNLQLLAALADIPPAGLPVLVGLSRKRLIGELTARGITERVHGSVAAALLAAQRGAAILRVHDVAATADALKVLMAIEGRAPAVGRAGG